MQDITEDTVGIIFSNTDDTAPAPKDSPLEATDTKVSSFTNGSSALDEMFKSTKSGQASADTNPDADPEETEGEAPEADAKDADKKGDLPEKPKDKADEKPEEKAGEKPADKAPATAAKPDEPKDKLAEVKLPPHAKPGTVKSFDEVKRRARDEIAAKDKEISDLKAKLPKDGGLTPEMKKEMDDLRAFRRAHDYQNDAEFKKNFVDPVEANNNSIVKKLETTGFNAEQIAKIKQIGFDKLDWTPIYEKHPHLQRSVEALLLDNERVSEKKAQALEAAKNNPQVFDEQQKKAAEDRATAEQTTEKQVVDDFLSKADWFKVTEVPANATAEQKADIDARNVFVKEQHERLKTLSSDRSPEMRGQMIASTLMAFKLQREAAFYKQKFEAADGELKKVRKASSTRSSRNAAAPGEVPPQKSSAFEPGTSALDNLRAQQVRD